MGMIEREAQRDAGAKRMADNECWAFAALLQHARGAFGLRGERVRIAEVRLAATDRDLPRALELVVGKLVWVGISAYHLLPIEE